MKDQLMLFGITLGKRNTYKRKVMFINEFSRALLERKIPIQIHQQKKGMQKSTHVALGDLKQASVIFIAGYDTADKIFLPNYRYYPFNTQKNIRSESRHLMIQTMLSIMLALMAAGLLLSLNHFTWVGKLIVGLAVLLLAGLILWMTKGIGNAINFNRNSASVALVHEIMKECADNKQIAAILADDTVASYQGLKQIRTWFSEDELKQKQFILLDCLAYGEMLVAAHGQTMKEQAQRLMKCSDLEMTERNYNAQRVEETALKFFTNSIYLVSGKIMDKEFVVEHTRSNQDYRIDVQRCEKIKTMLIKYAKGERK